MRIAISLVTVLCVALFFDAKFVGISAAHAQSRGLFGNQAGGSSGSGRGRTFTGGDVGGVTAGAQGGGRMNDSSLINGPARQGSFVGSDVADLQRFIGSSQADPQANAQRILRGLTQGFQSNQPQNQDSGRSQRKFRTRVRIGFRPVPISNAEVSERLSRTLSRSLHVRIAAGMRVVVDERTATLRGSVATHHARRLAEQLALLEPGVSRVQNEIVVIPPQDDQP